ncbi:MAG: hypothetical protein H6721_18475 [Sandaracinus sp.]|nr:hypothetical protein [Sandaracinus sp.]
MQLAGALNLVRGDLTGVQVSLLNLSLGALRGAQVGLLNVADRVRGAQIGW